MKRRLIASIFASVLMTVGGTTFVACGGADDEGGSTPAPTGERQTEERDTDQGESPQGGREDSEADERKDLISFRVEDRSQAGIDNFWLTWTIKNNSSEKSNYTWDWEALDASGTRVANGSQFETDVQPGQTATGEFPTTLKTADVKLNITDFNRTKAY